MRSIDVSARTVEEAINEGLAKLGCSISDCKVEILQEGAKGLFGFFGSKPATVRLTPNQADEDDDLGFDLTNSLAQEPARQPKAARRTQEAKAPAPKEEKKQEPPKKTAAEKKEKAPEKGRMRLASNPQVVDKPKSSDVLERFMNAPLPGGVTPEREPAKAMPPRQARPPRPAREMRDAYAEGESQSVERVPVPVPEHIEMHAPDTLEGIAQQFLMQLTQKMGVDVKVEVRRNEEGNLYVSMYGDTLGILIGRRGETLDALQYLTSLQVNRGREEYTRVTLDTENYRAKREEALSRLAARMASRAVKTGRKVSLEPMNPYERRILHASLQGNPNVTTHSEGDEPYRHVVVVPQK